MLHLLKLINRVLRAVGVGDAQLDRNERRGIAERAGHARKLIRMQRAAHRGHRAQLKAVGKRGDDAVDPARTHRQRDRAFAVERMPEREDAIA